MTVTRSKTISDELLRLLLVDFEATTTVSGDSVSFNALDDDETYEVLPDAFNFKPIVPRRTAIGLLRRALIDCRKAGPVTISALLARANELDHDRRAAPLQRFTIWTKFRASNMAHHPGFRAEWQGVRIRSAATLPGWLARGEYFVNGVGRIFPDKPWSYGHVILTCEDRDERSAMDRAMEALNLFMGLANIFDTFGRWSHGGHRHWTEGRWWLGPHQFVFRDRVFLSDQRVWYNPSYDETAWKTHSPSIGELAKVLPHTRQALRALADHPLRPLLLRSVLLMQDGFASRDGSHRLLRYWSALEKLYVEDGNRSSSNQRVIDRALFAEREPRISRWKLNHAAQLRNSHAHAGGTDDDLQTIGQFVRRLLARHLCYWIFHGARFKRQAQLLEFVDLPGDEAALARLRTTIDLRLELIRERPADTNAGDQSD